MLGTAVEAHASGVFNQNDAQNELCVPVVVTEGESYRLREARSRGGERLKK